MKNGSLKMLIVLLPTFVADIEIICGYNFVAPLKPRVINYLFLYAIVFAVPTT